MASSISGTRFYVGERGDPRREGTIGGIVEVHGIFYGLTVLRPFLLNPDQADLFTEQRSPVTDESSTQGLFAPISSLIEADAAHARLIGSKTCVLFATDVYDYQTEELIGAIPELTGLYAVDSRYWHRSGNWVLVRLENQGPFSDEDAIRLHSVSRTCFPGGRLRVALHHRRLTVQRCKLKVVSVPPVGRLYALSLVGNPEDGGAWVVDTDGMTVFAVVFGCYRGKTYARPALKLFNELSDKFRAKPAMIKMRSPCEDEWM
ncbi:uncharacterized protein BP01DRAFT_404012 [Aspergillus saccharolyticus JOP 1030-1]|uniref:Uncharacterized protein n=1 Tax=Aspergillus saccharolyticus JOP 1030-1 TaxID=1450539 RepID=A0A319A6T9_9EURO|nr:hypothetical protein BP01DRAFT_404012 [Aspergillus saccharolyticus JOP 1030-1]PYH43032.1 hypothetical protein BP01DRAFT_404012 [Aspergillus saccharolyticus JOP 1030-1]